MLELVGFDVGTDLDMMSQKDQLNGLFSCTHLTYYLIKLQTADFATLLIIQSTHALSCILQA